MRNGEENAVMLQQREVVAPEDKEENYDDNIPCHKACDPSTIK